MPKMWKQESRDDCRAIMNYIGRLEIKRLKAGNEKLRERVAELEGMYENLDSLCEYIGTELRSLTTNYFKTKEDRGDG